MRSGGSAASRATRAAGDLDGVAVTPIDGGIPIDQVLDQKLEHFRLRVLGPGLGDEDLVRMRRPEPGLLVEIGRQPVVGIDPLVEIERLQPDLKELRRSVVRRVHPRLRRR